ncbi:hypothetical protein CHUAL_005652 [Chamberlinius hualienensis]
MRAVKFPEVDSQLKKWFLQMENITTVTDAMLIEKGKAIAETLKVSEEDLCFSCGWLEKFKSRNGIKNAGIIACFKRKYRLHFVRYLIAELEKNYLVPSKLDILGAIRFTVEAWNEISMETIKNCWRHTGIMKKYEIDRDFYVTDDEEHDISAIKNAMSSLNLLSPMTVAQFINVPEERCIENILEVADTTQEEDMDESEEPLVISHSDAIKACEKLLIYLQQQSSDYAKDVCHLQQLKRGIVYN